MPALFNGKVAIVTGSSSGIGEAIAILFASKGASVTVCGRNQERLSSVFEKLVKANGGHRDKIITVAGDVSDTSVRKEIVDKTVQAFGRLDILVANAGIFEPNLAVCTATEETYDKVMNTNLKSVFFLIQHAVPHLEKTKGSIINISSIASTVPVSSFAVYCISKAGLDHLTRCLAVDLGAKCIRVNSISPGYVPTNILRSTVEQMKRLNITQSQDSSSFQALKGRPLTAEDIAETVAFLASDAAGCITGETIKVDGGASYTLHSTTSDL